jgi:hypothetical protein
MRSKSALECGSSLPPSQLPISDILLFKEAASCRTSKGFASFKNHAALKPLFSPVSAIPQ